MKAETLKKILDNIPGDYDIYFQDKKISAKIEIDIDNERIILK